MPTHPTHLSLLAVGVALGLGCLSGSTPQPAPTPRQPPPSGYWGPCAGGTDDFQVAYTYDAQGRVKRLQGEEGGVEYTYHDRGFLLGVTPLPPKGEPPGADVPSVLRLEERPLARSRVKRWLDARAPQEADALMEAARAVTAGACPAEQTLLLLYPFFSSPRSYMAGRNYVNAALGHTLHVVGDTVYEASGVADGLTAVTIGPAGVTLRYDTDTTYEGYTFNELGCATAMTREHYSGKYDSSGYIGYDGLRLAEFSTAGSFMVDPTRTALRYNAQGGLVGLGDRVTFQYTCPGRTSHVVGAR